MGMRLRNVMMRCIDHLFSTLSVAKHFLSNLVKVYECNATLLR